LGLSVRNAGAWTTVQDLGRPGHRDRGVPACGAFDRASFRLANALLGNPDDAAALEFTLLGGAYEATSPLALAIAGAPFSATVERAGGLDVGLRVPQSFAMGPGDRLVVGGSASGARAYLAVRGGWRTRGVLGSRSSEAPVRAGEVLPAEPGECRARRLAVEPAWSPSPPERPIPLRLLDGPEAASAGWDGAEYEVGADSNRIGLRLEGPPWPGTAGADADRLSAPVVPGAVQVAGGRPIVLGVAGGTMGGYPHVAQVIRADLDRLGQLRPGDRVVLRRVGRAEALRLDDLRREAVRALALRVRVAASG
jgi:allophanate hydrolase subunit 2